MKTLSRLTAPLLLISLAALAIAQPPALPTDPIPGTKQPSPVPASLPEKPATPAKAGGERVGDPYPFDTCPVCGKKLGAGEVPVRRIYNGREVRFASEICSLRFEKNLPANLQKLDEKIIKDQAPLYPLKTSVVTGKDLPGGTLKPVQYVYGNRLILLGADSEIAEFNKEPRKYLDALDTAANAAQVKTYPLKTCPVTREDLGDMGGPTDIVIAGRLIRLCCGACIKDVDKNPAKYIAMIDAARGGAADPGSPKKDLTEPRPTAPGK